MLLTTNVRLLPSAEQAILLRRTLEKCNEPCEWISGKAVETNTFTQFRLHAEVYRETRERFGLCAQAAVRCIAKVVIAHKTEKTNRKRRIKAWNAGRKRAARTGRPWRRKPIPDVDKPLRFRQYAAQPYDPRILRFCDDGTVSVWTLDGRAKVPVRMSDRQRDLLKTGRGEVDLIRTRNGKWLLSVPYEAQEEPASEVDDYLGLDLGIVNLLVDSDGETHSGETVETVRRRYAHRRRNLQRKGTRAAKRKLRQVGNKEARFRRDMNHRISRAVVSKAKRTGRGIALEELGAGPADHVAARNIAFRARVAVNRPNGLCLGTSQGSGFS